MCELTDKESYNIVGVYLRNEFDFWKVHGIMITSGLLQSKWIPKGFTLTLQETRSIHDSMNIPKIEFITYIYILYYQSSINFQCSAYFAGFSDILNKFRHNVGFGIAETPRLTSWRYVFKVTQTSVNKQRYWMDLPLARSNGVY